MMTTRLSTRRTLRRALAASALIVAFSLTPAAQSTPPTLPTFALTRTNGTSTSSAALVQSGPWMLVVSQQPCATCDALLAGVNATVPVDRASRIALVLGGASLAEASIVVPRYPRLADSRWFLDVDRAALPALGLSGAPVLVGLRGDRVYWKRVGTSMSTSDLQALITSWIR